MLHKGMVACCGQPAQRLANVLAKSVASTLQTAVLAHSAGWRRGVVVCGVGLINEVNRHRARLALGWVTVCGRVNHLGM